MSGETDLQLLLRSLEPVLDPRIFVYASFPEADISGAAQFDPVGVFVEPEGLTVIAEESALRDAAGPEAPRFRMVSLSVHSSLEAVGLTAAFASALAEVGISANVVAGYYHDHLFVPVRDADRAIEVLHELSRC